MDYLFNAWEEIKARLKDKLLFIFLDFDGTLTPIVATPEKAALSQETRGVLERISGNPELKLAFISGRSLKDIKNKIGLENVIYSGNHGLEIEGPKIKFEPLISAGFRKILERIKSELENKLVSVKGAFVEDKGLSLSFHYRLVEEKQIPLAKAAFHEVTLSDLEGKRIKIKPGKKVLQVVPASGWDKAKMVLWILAREEVFTSEKKDICPVYIGDDLTDEDVFNALKKRGLTVFVGESNQSNAQYYLKNPREVLDFLKRISDI